MGSSVETLKYHIVWCTKYRYNMLGEHMVTVLRNYLEKKQTSLNYSILSLAIEPNHVHLLIEVSSSSVNINTLIQRLKGGSSRLLRKQFVGLNRYPTLWTPSHFCATIGNVSENTIKNYINSQGIFEQETIVRTFKYKILKSSRKFNILKQYLEGVETNNSSKVPSAMLFGKSFIPYKNAFVLRNDLIKLSQSANTATHWLRIPGGVKCSTKPFWLGLVGRKLPENAKLCDSFIKHIGNRYVVYLKFSEIKVLPKAISGSCVALDLGVNHPITSVTLKNGKIISAQHLGKNLKNVLWNRTRRQAELQTLALMYPNPGVDIKAKLACYTNKINDLIHQYTSLIVKQALKHDASIVVGNINGLRVSRWGKGKCSKTLRKCGSNLPLYKIAMQLWYKGTLAGIPVVFVPENFSSQRCSCCGCIEKTNRFGQRFHCKQCGYQNQADVNGAINLGSWALANWLGHEASCASNSLMTWPVQETSFSLIREGDLRL